MAEFTLTKQISKQGSQSIIVIPKILNTKLKPKTLVEVKIKVPEEVQEDETN
ncbi:MAG: hypothetical protein AABW53_00925 [Nanoarchaeota archaeon]